jgi:hypothetical protein
MLTANVLREGDVVYWKDGAWVLDMDAGDIFTDPAKANDALAAAQASLPLNKVVAPYLFDVRIEQGKIRPVKEREIIRAAGPTVHKHTGKQAGQYNV